MRYSEILKNKSSYPYRWLARRKTSRHGIIVQDWFDGFVGINHMARQAEYYMEAQTKQFGTSPLKVRDSRQFRQDREHKKRMQTTFNGCFFSFRCNSNYEAIEDDGYVFWGSLASSPVNHEVKLTKRLWHSFVQLPMQNKCGNQGPFTLRQLVLSIPFCLDSRPCFFQVVERKEHSFENTVYVYTRKTMESHGKFHGQNLAALRPLPKD